MTVALFGKVQTKRDFVAPGAPRGFLDAWEPWMQAGLSSSRLALGDQWPQRYLTAPIWRFWLGDEICGASISGAFMPSLDGVGRFYPLAAFSAAPAGFAIPSPDLDPLENWRLTIDDFLFRTLEPDWEWERTLAMAQALPDPVFWPPVVAQGGVEALAGSALGSRAAPQAAQSAFAMLAAADWASAHARNACFWTEGGDSFPPYALRSRGLPAPELFTLFLTGPSQSRTDAQASAHRHVASEASDA